MQGLRQPEKMEEPEQIDRQQHSGEAHTCSQATLGVQGVPWVGPDSLYLAPNSLESFA